MIDCNCEIWTAENEVEFFSNASTTASASPSMLAYLDSADEVHRLPTRVTFQPEWQQGGFVGAQLQCFLQEPEADAFLAEVSCEACWSSFIKYLNPFLYFLYNYDNFGRFKKGVEIVGSFEY